MGLLMAAPLLRGPGSMQFGIRRFDAVSLPKRETVKLDSGVEGFRSARTVLAM